VLACPTPSAVTNSCRFLRERHGLSARPWPARLRRRKGHSSRPQPCSRSSGMAPRPPAIATAPTRTCGSAGNHRAGFFGADMSADAMKVLSAALADLSFAYALRTTVAPISKSSAAGGMIQTRPVPCGTEGRAAQHRSSDVRDASCLAKAYLPASFRVPTGNPNASSAFSGSKPRV
jgi:hypothetical protein